MNELDSAEYYYNRAKTVLNDTISIMYRDIAYHQICLEYKRNTMLADSAIIRLRQLLLKSENNIEYLARHAAIGEVFYHEKQFDSAWIYLNKVYHETPSIGIKKQVAEWLLEICKVQGRTQEMLDYSEILVPFANQEENNSGRKTQLLKLFDAFKQKVIENQTQNESVVLKKRVVWTLVGMLAMMLTILSFHLKNKRGRQNLKAQMEAERYAHKMQQAALAGRLKKSNAALKEKGTANTNISRHSDSQHHNEADNYFDEPVCKKILDVCNNKSHPIKSSIPLSAYADIALSDIQKAQLKNAALHHYKHLFEKLKLQYPELKEKDYYYCFLCLLGLDNAQIAVMMQLSYRTVWEREKRLQTLFHTDGRIAVALNEILIH
jgi:hypothetical protein